ncbi:MAG: hypothetical protein SFV23_25920, partial [Planctomycetaceae bacterium]|nr:hypothetical protein [Planctomycetaceae bacterium]
AGAAAESAAVSRQWTGVESACGGSSRTILPAADVSERTAGQSTGAATGRVATAAHVLNPEAAHLATDD